MCAPGMYGESAPAFALVDGVGRALACAIASSCGDSAAEAAKDCTATVAKKTPHIFDSSEVPAISIERYLLRLKAVFRCSDAAFVVALVILDRFLEGPSVPFSDKAVEQPRPRLCALNAHRLFLTSLLLAVKFNEDHVYANVHYAKAGGIHLREVNRLELFLLRAIDYDLHVHPEQYGQYVDALRILASTPTPAATAGVRPSPVARQLLRPASAKASVGSVAQPSLASHAAMLAATTTSAAITPFAAQRSAAKASSDMQSSDGAYSADVACASTFSAANPTEIAHLLVASVNRVVQNSSAAALREAAPSAAAPSEASLASSASPNMAASAAQRPPSVAATSPTAPSPSAIPEVMLAEAPNLDDAVAPAESSSTTLLPPEAAAPPSVTPTENAATSASASGTASLATPSGASAARFEEAGSFSPAALAAAPLTALPAASPTVRVAAQAAPLPDHVPIPASAARRRRQRR